MFKLLFREFPCTTGISFTIINVLPLIYMWFEFCFWGIYLVSMVTPCIARVNCSCWARMPERINVADGVSVDSFSTWKKSFHLFHDSIWFITTKPCSKLRINSRFWKPVRWPHHLGYSLGYVGRLWQWHGGSVCPLPIAVHWAGTAYALRAVISLKP